MINYVYVILISAYNRITILLIKTFYIKVSIFKVKQLFKFFSELLISVKYAVKN